MKRHNNPKKTTPKPRARKPAPKQVEVVQTVDHKPALADQRQPEGRNGRGDGGQIGRKLSQGEILHLQRLHGNGYVQRLLTEIGGKNGRVNGHGLQRQEEHDDPPGPNGVGHVGSTSQTATGSNGVSPGQDTGQNQQHTGSSQKSKTTSGPEVSGSQSVGSKQNKQGTGPVTQNGAGPGPQEAQSQTSDQGAHEEMHQQEAQGGEQAENQQETPVEENRSGAAPGKKGQASDEKQAENKGQPGQKGESDPDGRKGSGQEAQAPGTESTSAGAVPAGQASGAAAQGSSPQSAQEDPDYQTAVNQVKQAAQQEQAHPPATDKAQEAQAAAQAPGSEIEARAQANQAQEMEQTEAPPFDAAGFKAQLMQRLQALTPGTAGDAEQFKSSNKVGALKGELKGKVEQEGQKSKGPLEEKSAQAPDTAAIPPKPVTPLQEYQAGPTPVVPGAKQAVPKPKGQEEVEAPIQQGSQHLDDQMAGAQITEEQLSNSNEPEFQGALESKQEAQERAEQAPPEYRQQEQEEISGAQSEAGSTAETKLNEMHGQHEQVGTQVGGKQGQAKSADEQKRAEVGAQIQSIFNGTRGNVQKILSELDGQVDAVFSAGAEAAKSAFENYVDSRMKAYKEERYGGLDGALLWLKDKFLGMPPEVNAFFQEGRRAYLEQMDAVIDQVVTMIGSALQQALAEVANGRAQIDAYVAQLPAELQEVGQQAAQDIQEGFNQLEAQVHETEAALIEELAQLYEAHLQEIEARLNTLRSENQGLLQKAATAIKGVIGTILQLRDKLGSILQSAVSAVKDILKDPIGFLGNLINGVSQGFQKFFGNIVTHLSSGLIKWLGETLGDAGLELPESFDLKGLFGMVMQVLGVTWDKVRDRATALLGENVVSQLEQVFDVFVALKNEGFAGIWEFISGTVSNIKEIIFEPIQEFIINEVIQGGIQKIIGFLGGPAQAFVKAAEGIYKVVSWFIGKGQKVTSLVGAIFQSIKAIAGGGVGQAAQLIEQALAKSIPTAISFLANILGLGNLADKIKEIILRIRNPIDRAIGLILKKATRMAQKIGGALGLGNQGDAQGG